MSSLVSSFVSVLSVAISPVSVSVLSLTSDGERSIRSSTSRGKAIEPEPASAIESLQVVSVPI